MAGHVVDDSSGGSDVHGLRRGGRDVGEGAEVEGMPLRHRSDAHAYAERYQVKHYTKLF